MSSFLEEEDERREKNRVNNALWSLRREEEAARIDLKREIESLHEETLTYEDLQNELEPIIKRLETLERFLKTKQTDILKTLIPRVHE